MKRAILLLLCACLLAMCACTAKEEAPAELTLSDRLIPERADEHSDPFTANLYFVSTGARRLTVEQRSIPIQPGVSRAEAAVRALVAGPEGQSMQPCIQEGLLLERVEPSADACCVYLIGDVAPDMSMWLTARAAIAATLSELGEADSIELFYNGTDPGYEGRPLGAQSPITVALDVYIKGVEQEYGLTEATGETEAGSFATRTATLYYADISKKLLLARNVELNYDIQSTLPQIAELMLARLREGDSGENALEPVLPPDFKLAMEPVLLLPGASAQERTTHDAQPTPPPAAEDAMAEHIVELVLSPSDYQTDTELMCGAITLTLTGYLPHITGVRIWQQEADGTLRDLNPDNTYFTRAMFKERIGRVIYLNYPDAEGASFYRVSRAVAAADAHDPLPRLYALLDGPADPGVGYPVFTRADVKEAYIVGDTAVVNWRAGFMQKLASLPQAQSALPAAQRLWLFVYGVVDTLTELPGIQRVWMLEDGARLGDIEDMYLGNALLRNPGIVMEK